MERVPFGIEGLDKLIQGGIPRGNSVLVCGTPGTGKTILSLWYLYYGATQCGEKGIYITLEENPEDIKNQALQFGWDFEKLENEGRIKIVKIPIDTINTDLFQLIGDAFYELKEVKRMVIDSLSILSINASMYKLPVKAIIDGEEKYINNFETAISSEEKLRQFIYIFVSKISELGATILFIGDSPQNGPFLTRDTVSEFVCDGLIKLQVKEFGKTIVRTIEVKKMRSTKLEMGFHTFEVMDNGLFVKAFDY